MIKNLRGTLLSLLITFAVFGSLPASPRRSALPSTHIVEIVGYSRVGTVVSTNVSCVITLSGGVVDERTVNIPDGLTPVEFNDAVLSEVMEDTGEDGDTFLLMAGCVANKAKGSL